MSDQPGPLPVAKISQMIRTAVAATPEEAVVPAAAPISADTHSRYIDTSLARARRKAFVPLPKLLRRLFRNQGAVNDSVIEAVHHLAAQNRELIEEIIELRLGVARLQRQLRELPRLALPKAESAESNASESEPLKLRLPARSADGRGKARDTTCE